jgi:ankyrin repeat protein
MSISGLSGPSSFHENLAAPYLDTNDGLFASQDMNLYEIISHRTVEEIDNILSSGIPVNTKDTLGNSPLHAAISRGEVRIVKSLLSYGANIDAIGFRGKTPLHLAAEFSSGNLKDILKQRILKLLLKHQPTLSLQDYEGNTVLHYILSIKEWWSSSDIVSAMKTALSHGADVNLTNKFGESPLHRLVTNVVLTSESYMDMVSEFLNHEPDVRSPTRNGSSLLAVFLDNSEILSEATSRWGASPSMEIGYKCLDLFLIAGSDPDMIYHSKPLLHYCLGNGQFREDDPWKQFLERLIQTANLEVVAPGGDYPVHIALSRRPVKQYPHEEAFASYTIVDMLLAQNVNVNRTNTAGASPLELWLTGGSWRRPEFKKVALLLIHHGASTTVFTSNGKTLFDLMGYFTKHERIYLTKDLLNGDIDSQRDEVDSVRRPEWAEAWGMAWRQSLWHLAKSHFLALEYLPSRPKIKEFNDCAFLVLAERLLERHRARLRLWQTGEVGKESVRDDYEEYCAILRDCRQRNAELDASWYAYLLELMDFN